VLRVAEVGVVPGAPGAVRLRFPAVAGRAYALQRTRDLPAVDWETVATWPPASADGEVTFDDPLPAGEPATTRFYRVVIP
jgi:hypothetical protein